MQFRFQEPYDKRVAEALASNAGSVEPDLVEPNLVEQSIVEPSAKTRNTVTRNTVTRNTINPDPQKPNVAVPKTAETSAAAHSTAGFNAVRADARAVLEPFESEADPDYAEATMSYSSLTPADVAMDLRLAQALARQPQTAIPGDFAARVAARLPVRAGLRAAFQVNALTGSRLVAGSSLDPLRPPSRLPRDQRSLAAIAGLSLSPLPRYSFYALLGCAAALLTATGFLAPRTSYGSPMWIILQWIVCAQLIAALLGLRWRAQIFD